MASKKLPWKDERKAHQSMIQRCHNPNCHNYDLYGGRGIVVCDEWRNSFDAFFAHIGPRPSKDHSVDRFPNVNGNYEPGNVRWATREEQQNNRRNNRLLTAFGKTQSLTQWAREYKINWRTIFLRLESGMPSEEALSMPVNRRIITAFGKTQTIADWARDTGIDSTTISNRIKAGVLVEDALSKPTRTVIIKVFGREQTLSKWAREFGIDKNTFRYRLKMGMDPEAALKTKPAPTGR